jgi:hypothetical protein
MHMKITLRLGILLLVSVVLVGCATLGMGRGSWARFVPDRSVQAAFEAGQLDPDTNYYFSGPQSSPLAIVGLNKKYVLDNALWKPINTSKMCLDLVQACLTEDMKDQVRDVHGFAMYAPSGEKIGVWFGDMHRKMRAKMGSGNKVVVYTPDQYVPEYQGE